MATGPMGVTSGRFGSGQRRREGLIWVNLRRLAAPALGPVIHGQRPASLETHFRRAFDVAAVWGCPNIAKAPRCVFRVYIKRTI
jgi:hypothetical protein